MVDGVPENEGEKVNVILPLIRAREQQSLAKKDIVATYVDTLLQLELEIDGKTRNLPEQEMVSLCSEFMHVGTDTTATSLQWIMANIVKYPRIQDNLFQEMKSVLGGDAEEVQEETLPKLPYLKATVLEALRRHPPGHFILPHGVQTREVPAWTRRSKEIKMMPFGVGRRMCPGYGLAMLHLEYFVANLVRKFEWKAVKEDDVDMTEKTEFTVVMKHPLRAEISHWENR
ncbi:Cytochrome P450 89A2-like protein [Drosera capensis]